MLPYELVDGTKARAAIKALNEIAADLEQFGYVKIKTIGVKNADLAAAFVEAVLKVPDDQKGDLPEVVIELYNEIATGGDGGGEQKAEEAEKAAPAEGAEKPEAEKPEKVKAEKSKKEKPPKDPNAPKRPPPPKGELTTWGHVKGTQAGNIDEVLQDGEGHSLQEIAEKVNCSIVRVKRHLVHLKSDRGLPFEEKDGFLKVVLPAKTE